MARYRNSQHLDNDPRIGKLITANRHAFEDFNPERKEVMSRSPHCDRRRASRRSRCIGGVTATGGAGAGASRLVGAREAKGRPMPQQSRALQRMMAMVTTTAAVKARECTAACMWVSVRWRRLPPFRLEHLLLSLAASPARRGSASLSIQARAHRELRWNLEVAPLLSTPPASTCATSPNTSTTSTT